MKLTEKQMVALMSFNENDCLLKSRPEKGPAIQTLRALEKKALLSSVKTGVFGKLLINHI